MLIWAVHIATQLKTGLEELPFTSKTEHLFLVVFGHDIISNSNVQRRKAAKFKNTAVIVSRNVVLIVFQSTM